MPAEVDVIIVAYNSGALLADSVASAVAEVGEERVWVVDNASTDGSVAAVQQRFGAVHVLPVDNRGFSAGNNRGIEATTAPFVMLLNPDAVIEPGAVAALLQTMEAVPDAGIVGPAVRNPDGTPQAGSYGRFPSLPVRLGQALHRLGLRLARRPELARIPASRKAVDWVSGAAMLVRRAAIEASGQMDEAFFLYYEDIEWCHRMRDRGWRTLLEPRAGVIHHLGKSGAGSRANAAYRASFDHYTDLYGLWGLRLAAHIGLALRGEGR